ncbi:hypothetical protein [Chitinolyticbacter albus]|uniref:hypothetical protein n=1 Tax=Chitinolyticbacter albus TaxID=2961951 RepID=UPI00210AE8B9|nr:hypothetical protein [Chitinolyticbacter albus]
MNELNTNASSEQSVHSSTSDLPAGSILLIEVLALAVVAVFAAFEVRQRKKCGKRQRFTK